ncbi:MAG: LCP family protein [Lachnospiraceae bacterium]|nr:LCP family protein [Lachnospiraceae bacterium]
MGRRRKKAGPIRIIIPIIVIIVLASLALSAIILKKLKENNIQAGSAVEAPDYDNADKWSEGIVTYNNQRYRYNNKIRTYLFMGIDTDEPVHKAEDGISGGQADALFLIVIDKSHEKLSLISIHRNLMTTVKMYNREGEYTGDAELQICLQHGYGDGERLSCQRTVDCVSNLFYGIPIHGYVSLNMGGIGLLNDALGGVELTVMQDLNVQGRNVRLTAGETKVLNGDEAYVYVRSRDTSQFDSASDRLARQEQYLNKMVPVLLKRIKRASSAVSVYGASEDYIFSNIDYNRLADEIDDVTYDSSEGMLEIPGEVVMGEQLEEFYADDEGLYQLILDVFYDKVS